MDKQPEDKVIKQEVSKGDHPYNVLVEAPDGTMHLITSIEDWHALKAKYGTKAERDAKKKVN